MQCSAVKYCPIQCILLQRSAVQCNTGKCRFHRQPLLPKLFGLIWYQCYYPHTTRDSVSPVCGILINNLQVNFHNSCLQDPEDGIWQNDKTGRVRGLVDVLCPICKVQARSDVFIDFEKFRSIPIKLIQTPQLSEFRKYDRQQSWT